MLSYVCIVIPIALPRQAMLESVAKVQPDRLLTRAAL
jgi:hypothetical protein